jgi:DNA-binding LacI/PurR family transcriptional regulator
LDEIASGQSVEHIQDFLDGSPDITGVITANTELCRNVYRAAVASRRRVPDDLELITFDPPDLPNVPYIRQNEEEMCRLTIELLTEQIEGAFEARRIVVPVQLVKE